jgi:hypothetical protein
VDGSPDVDWDNVVNELVDPGALEMVAEQQLVIFIIVR